MKPTIRKHKDIRGRRIVGYTALFGPIESRRHADTDTERGQDQAVAECEQLVRDALERLDRGAHIGQWRGHTYVVSPDAHGWRLWCDVFSRTDYYTAQAGTRDEAIDSILSHLAANIWTVDVEDDTAFVDGLPYPVRTELIGRFKWYREMKRLMDNGYTDQEARDIIGGFKKQEAVNA